MIAAISEDFSSSRRSNARLMFFRVGQIHDELLWHDTAKKFVHPFVGIADRHRGERVAVVAAAKTDELCPPLALIQPELHSHFQRDFDGDGSGFAEEDVIQVTGQHRRKARGELVSGFVRQAAEHHVRHFLKLFPHGFQNVRMRVAVTSRPPTRNAIDQFPAVGELKSHSRRRHDRHRQLSRFHLRVRQPDVIEIEPVGIGHEKTTLQFRSRSKLSQDFWRRGNY